MSDYPAANPFFDDAYWAAFLDELYHSFDALPDPVIASREGVGDGATSFLFPPLNPTTKRYACTQPGCTITFTRSQDRLRHIDSVHRRQGTGGGIFCTVRGCSRSRGKGLSRPDKLREHMRRIHGIVGNQSQNQMQGMGVMNGTGGGSGQMGGMIDRITSGGTFGTAANTFDTSGN